MNWTHTLLIDSLYLKDKISKGTLPKNSVYPLEAHGMHLHIPPQKISESLNSSPHLN